MVTLPKATWLTIVLVVSCLAIGVLTCQCRQKNGEVAKQVEPNENFSKLSEKKELKVTVSTDRTEYTQGEIIKITITNGLKESIFSHIGSGTPVFAIKYIERKMPEGGGERFLAQCQPPHCVDDIDAPAEIKPGQSEILEWKPLIFVNGTSETIPVGPGEYRLSILYEDYQKTRWKSIYTNEFKIR